MTNNYREHQIFLLKQDNQRLWEELSELPYNSLAYKGVRKEIKDNDTDISELQDIIKRSAPIAVEAEAELITL